jgi:hypothetical protein
MVVHEQYKHVLYSHIYINYFRVAPFQVQTLFFLSRLILEVLSPLQLVGLYLFMPASFQSLPSELLLFICKFLDLEQLVHFSQVMYPIFCRID